MKRISINNGNTFTTVDNAILLLDWDVIRLYMDDNTVNTILNYETVNNDTDMLTLYLKKANHNLIIG